MCGIAGLVNPGGARREFQTILGRMVGSMTHRGPDDEGVFIDGPAGIGMRRLSIIDLEGGHQPIENEDGGVAVVCNGEIYNHEELRKQLIGSGHTFRTRSDVEVLVHLYEERGESLVDELRGMYGFALWDRARQRLLVARDRLGIKPVFFAWADGRLLVGSEIKAILESGLVPRELDWPALDRFLSYGYVPAPRTIYRGIRKLEPGHRLLWEAGRLLEERYWKPVFPAGIPAREEELRERFLELFRETVRDHLMSDVPLGAFLSGGIDSSLIVAIMSECMDSPVRTFTMGFGGDKGGYLDERRFARLVSRRYGTEHTEFEVQPDLTAVIDPIVEAFDEPFADDSVIPTYYICKLAREKVKVALTGLGGDELFGGYERYLGMKLSQIYDRLPALLTRRLIGPLIERLPELRSGHYTINHMKRFVRSARLAPAGRYRQYVSVFSEAEKALLLTRDAWAELERNREPDEFPEHFHSNEGANLLDQAACADLHTYLPEDILALTDRLSMHHSLELRVPFVDHRLVEFCLGIPSSLKIKRMTKKYFLRRTARPFLPAEVIEHRKQGFASPMSAWLRGDLADYFRDSLSETALARHGLLDPAYVAGLMEDHLARKELRDRHVFTVFMFQRWFETFMREAGGVRAHAGATG